MLPMFWEQFGNASSATHPYGWFAGEKVEIAREQVADLIGARPQEIIFTSGATESNNLVFGGVAQWARTKQRSESGEPAHFISIVSEHRAILDPLRELEHEGFTCTFVPIMPDGFVDRDAFRAAIRPSTVLVSIMLGNNEIGTLEDIAWFSQGLREQQILLHCDATQAVGKVPIDVKALGVDFLSLSAHKFYGPKGVGGLFIRSGLATKLRPRQFGGGQELGLRSGTLNTPGIVGLGRACEVAKQEMEFESLRIQSLSSKLLTGLQQVGDVLLNGSALSRLPGSLNVRICGVDHVRLISDMQQDLAFSIGSACMSQKQTSSHVLEALGLSPEAQRESIRLGIGRFTTVEEISIAVDIFGNAIRTIRG